MSSSWSSFGESVDIYHLWSVGDTFIFFFLVLFDNVNDDDDDDKHRYTLSIINLLFFFFLLQLLHYHKVFVIRDSTCFIFFSGHLLLPAAHCRCLSSSSWGIENDFFPFIHVPIPIRFLTLFCSKTKQQKKQNNNEKTSIIMVWYCNCRFSLSIEKKERETRRIISK